MNSLEYIDREISSTEIDLWYSKRLLIENPPNEELKKEILEVKINVLERNMKFLQQIKSELEAWEIVKNKSVDMHDVIYCSNAEVYNCGLYEKYQLTEEEYNKIKKTLEVENE